MKKVGYIEIKGVEPISLGENLKTIKEKLDKAGINLDRDTDDSEYYNVDLDANGELSLIVDKDTNELIGLYQCDYIADSDFPVTIEVDNNKYTFNDAGVVCELDMDCIDLEEKFEEIRKRELEAGKKEVQEKIKTDLEYRDRYEKLKAYVTENLSSILKEQEEVMKKVEESLPAEIFNRMYGNKEKLDFEEEVENEVVALLHNSVEYPIDGLFHYEKVESNGKEYLIQVTEIHEPEQPLVMVEANYARRNPYTLGEINLTNLIK